MTTFTLRTKANSTYPKEKKTACTFDFQILGRGSQNGS